MTIVPFLTQLATIIHQFLSEKSLTPLREQTLLFLLNCVIVLAFSGKRRRSLPSSFESDLVKLYSHLSLSNKQLFLPYSPLQCLQLLLSPNR